MAVTSTRNLASSIDLLPALLSKTELVQILVVVLRVVASEDIEFALVEGHRVVLNERGLLVRSSGGLRGSQPSEDWLRRRVGRRGVLASRVRSSRGVGGSGFGFFLFSEFVGGDEGDPRELVLVFHSTL